ncbi:CLUMA_CG002065, isoform A [Clunio marinus]|uniref:CLUMA_CG002065, isoform A n=1 Tax=Clunio marinus TaxID=568069 RepID=A0A1J1HP84_9DIPT|nr:CLUMA_CG002065, isoform A [Clunio marinus]
MSSRILDIRYVDCFQSNFEMLFSSFKDLSDSFDHKELFRLYLTAQPFSKKTLRAAAFKRKLSENGKLFSLLHYGAFGVAKTFIVSCFIHTDGHNQSSHFYSFRSM